MSSIVKIIGDYKMYKKATVSNLHLLFLKVSQVNQILVSLSLKHGPRQLPPPAESHPQTFPQNQ